MTQIINFEERRWHWPFLQPSAAVDTTVVKIWAPRLRSWEYTNPLRCKGFFILYEAVVSLGTGRCVAFSGPFKGSTQDFQIAKHTIVPYLEPEECLLGDRAYRGDDFHFMPSPPGVTAKMTAEERLWAWYVHTGRQIVERFFYRVKRYGLFDGTWRYSFALHKLLAHTVVALINLDLINRPLDKAK